ncbi:SDR family NAD(P)-dependent oxidoreductase [Burkholderia gladioli]|uniref:SDR family NAD(P)-dependent oxidoreductase n=1 Tax=Burkholderia gladioli TaxID=28095 RepID=UPI001C2462FD|nr:SDR family NAD(P)-dependent oxidoreductase [Burkholderia gladioli]MBU9684821.1 SDR family NAD(P)-dependent oxidoreductase [Burkholderia gladioli]
MKNFTNKVAAITGAGSGMGRSLAVELARRGCDLALSDINEIALAQTVSLCNAQGVRVTAQRLDVASREAVFAWARATREAHGRINLIFNNAGVSLTAPAESVQIEDFEWLMGINFWGVVHGTQAFLPHLLESGDGHVINTSSLFGLIAMPTQSTYNASKFAVRGFTESLRMELEIEGAPVSATCVHPGGVATNIVNASRIDEKILALTGQDVEAHRRSANKLINATSADEAARQILAGVERNARRVLVGADARRLDRLARLFGSAYQVFVLRFVRQSRQRNFQRHGSGRANPASSTTTRDAA